MKNRFALLIVAGAIALPAVAQDAEWKFYGTLLPFVDNIQTSGATVNTSTTTPLALNSFVSLGAASATTGPAATNVTSRNRMTWGTSNMGFKGTYKINDDIKVIWQMESSTSLDGDAPAVLAGRNSMLGLAGKTWGQVFVGSWDTPYKFPTLFLGAMRGANPFDANIMGNPGFNIPGTVTNSGRAGSKNDASFNRRQGNSIQYWSPTVAGFSGRLAYSMNETKPATDAVTTAQISPTIVSALVSYKIGSLTLHYGYEQHNDYFGLSQMPAATVGAAGTLTNRSSKDEGHELVALYNIAPTGTRITFLVEQLKYHNDDSVATNLNEYKRLSWILSAQQSFGAHKVFGSYGQANEGSGSKVNGTTTTTDGLGAKQYSLGYSYALNKSADLYVAYYGMQNDKAATYGLWPQLGANPGASATTVNPGSDTRGFGFGMLYTW